MSALRRFQVRRRAPGANPLRILLMWDVVRPLCHLWFKLCYRIRLVGEERIPRHGPLIYASNHQSHFDPIIVGILTHDRPLTALARTTLFRFPLSFMMRSVGAIPIERGKGDRGAMKTALGVLEAGRCVAMYPEGTRSVDGSLGEFRNGVLLLARRSKAPVVPIAIEGAWDVWPKGRGRPYLFGRVAVEAGDPISADELRAEGDHALERLRREIETMRMALRRQMRETSRGCRPAPGPADVPYWERS